MLRFIYFFIIFATIFLVGFKLLFVYDLIPTETENKIIHYIFEKSKIDLFFNQYLYLLFGISIGNILGYATKEHNDKVEKQNKK